MTQLVGALLFTSLTIFVHAQPNPDKDKERINAVCEKFMQNFQEEKIADAMQLLKENSVMAYSTIDTLQSTITDQLGTIIFPNYGRILSHQFITERKVKNFIAKRFYVLRLEKYFLKFAFTLYNNGKGWTITNFNYDEDLVEILY